MFMHFPTLKEEYREKAVINDEIFFRDYAVHQYLKSGFKNISITVRKSGCRKLIHMLPQGNGPYAPISRKQWIIL